jgi:hypothetical protein
MTLILSLLLNRGDNGEMSPFFNFSGRLASDGADVQQKRVRGELP